MSTTLAESESLRLKLQQIAHQQRARTIERRLQDGLQRRIREWNDTVQNYMDAVRLLEQLHETAIRAVRSEHLAGCVEAANIEIEQVRCRYSLIGEVLGSLNGININAESIEIVRNNTNRIAKLTSTLTEIVQHSEHINQGEKVRQFEQQLVELAKDLKAAESNAKYISTKTINVSSDVMLAKLNAFAQVELNKQFQSATP